MCIPFTELLTPLTRRLLRLQPRSASPTARLAEKLMERHLDRRERLAAQHPEWAAIQARRVIPGSTNTRLLGPGLTFADAARQREIEQQLLPDPVWFPFARFLIDRPAARTAAAARETVQRARRGWTDREMYALGSHLAATTAAQLTHLADRHHGWPYAEEFPTDQHWVDALRSAAAGLSRLAGSPETEAARDVWYELVSSRTASPAEIDAAADRMHALEAADVAAAKAAMHWVADHLPDLWD
jgi:hypothetical protein